MQSSSTSDSYSSYSFSDVDTENMSWIERQCSRTENSYMCEIDEEYIRDAFNLYGLDSDCPNYKQAINMILNCESSSSDSSSDTVEENDLLETSIYLYGMIHARYIITLDGLETMLEKFQGHNFGVCSRVFCNKQALLPVGLHDKPNMECVKLFCPCCKEIYTPPDRFAIDGAFFGTTFPHMFLLQYPQYLSSPVKPYQPTIFGYKIHNSSPYYRESDKKTKKEKDMNKA